MAEPTAKTSWTDRRELLSQEERERAMHAADLIQSWIEDESGYDQEIWPLVERELSNIRTRIGG